MILVFGKRQYYFESRAHGDFAHHTNFAAEQLAELFAYRQTQAAASELTAAGIFSLFKGIKDVCQVFRANACAGIGDADNKAICCWLLASVQAYVDSAAPVVAASGKFIAFHGRAFLSHPIICSGEQFNCSCF